MIRILALLVLVTVFFTAPVFAQEDAEPIIGEGPKGRFTRGQAEAVALERIPGEVLETDSYWQDDRFYFVYDILVDDGSVYELEVNTLTGKVQKIEIESLAAGAKLPFNLVSEEMVQAIALDHVYKKTKGKIKPKHVRTELTVYKKRPVFKVTLKKSVKNYAVFYDAERGDFIKIEELK